MAVPPLDRGDAPLDGRVAVRFVKPAEIGAHRVDRDWVGWDADFARCFGARENLDDRRQTVGGGVFTEVGEVGEVGALVFRA